MKKKIDVPPFTKEEVAILKREERFEVLEERIFRLQDLVYKLKEDFLVHIKESKEVGVDDSEEVEFTEVELKCLRDSLVYTLQEPNSVHGNGVMNLLVKLNKMLKERESGEGDGLDKSLNF